MTSPSPENMFSGWKKFVDTTVTNWLVLNIFCKRFQKQVPSLQNDL
jgi:hypothetical protein